MAKKRATADERRHLAKVAALGCCVCGMPAEVHHITTGVGMGQRAGHYDTIPLCPQHHRLGGHGVAIHSGKKSWEQKHGTELEHLERTRAAIGGPVQDSN